MSNNIFTCQDGNTKEIKGFTWYKTLDNNINITHTENGNGKITARTLDKSNNMAEAVKEISVYKIIFKKGTADTIGGVATDIENYVLLKRVRLVVLLLLVLRKMVMK